MSKFKVGDRVRVYSHLAVFDGIVLDLFDSEQMRVERNTGSIWTVHKKQCRKLVKKKRREVWVNIYPDNLAWVAHRTREDAKEVANSLSTEVAVRFVEARKK